MRHARRRARRGKTGAELSKLGHAADAARQCEALRPAQQIEAEASDIPSGLVVDPGYFPEADGCGRSLFATKVMPAVRAALR